MLTTLPVVLFVHHVLFYVKDDASEMDKAKLLEGLHKLAQIPTIKLGHIGTPAATTRTVIDRTYTYSWVCFFESAEAEQDYQQHPIHDEFRDTYAPYWDKVIVYDALGNSFGAALEQ